ncbi:hypothetical protein [Streptosporangium saharense]|uniref:Uncharacterized protein n=1 Tax=Streptosporangium saharense TaxID=1706840 RepID=A0A7W7QWB1_9ACTN|nr:hypothetical protein [Streptosporangium saharense]MBB4920976.1 hypothetical protein [Streptosporangium saharense]
MSVKDDVAQDAPAEARVVPVDEEVPAQVARPVDVPDEQDQDEEAPDRGVPAAQLAAGGLSGSAVVLGGLYQLAGLPGLIGGGVMAAGSVIAYARHRYARRRTAGLWDHGGSGRSRQGRSGGGTAGLRSEGRAFRSSRSGSSGGLGGLLSGRSGRSGGGGLGGLLGGGRSRSGGGSAGGGGGRAGAGRSSAPSSSSRTGKTSRASGQVGAVRRGATGALHAAQNAARGARKAAAWADQRTGGRAGRAYRAVGRAGRAAVRTVGRAGLAQARRAWAWADRKTGKRISALVARLVKRWRRRKTTESAEATTDTTTETTADEAAEGDKPADTTDEAEEESPGVVHGGEGDLPITATVTCPRCQAEHTITVAQVGDTHTVECPCGYRIRFTRHPTPAPPTTDTPITDTADQAAPTTHTRRSTTMGFPLADAAAELNSAAVHVPEPMLEILAQLDRLPEIPTQVAIAINTYGAKLHNTKPLDAGVIELIMQLRDSLGRSAQIAAEIGPLARRIHAPDLKRHHAPRVDEAAWDVSRH